MEIMARAMLEPTTGRSHTWSVTARANARFGLGMCWGVLFGGVFLRSDLGSGMGVTTQGGLIFLFAEGSFSCSRGSLGFCGKLGTIGCLPIN